MVPVLLEKRANMSFDYNPRFGSQKPMAVLRVFEIMVGVMFFHLPAVVITQTSGWRRAPHGLSVGASAGYEPPWGTIEGLLMVCVLSFSPGTVPLGCERQPD